MKCPPSPSLSPHWLIASATIREVSDSSNGVWITTGTRDTQVSIARRSTPFQMLAWRSTPSRPERRVISRASGAQQLRRPVSRHSAGFSYPPPSPHDRPCIVVPCGTFARERRIGAAVQAMHQRATRGDTRAVCVEAKPCRGLSRNTSLSTVSREHIEMLTLAITAAALA